MSSRVQKGNTVFKPITKPRARHAGDARQASSTPAPESRSVSVLRDSQPPESAPASTSVTRPMGPPSIIPSKPSTQVIPSTVSQRKDSAMLRNTQSASTISIPTRDSARPPAIPSVIPSRSSNTTRPIQAPSINSKPVPISVPIAVPSRQNTTTPASIVPAPPPAFSTEQGAAPSSSTQPQHAASSSQLSEAIAEPAQRSDISSSVADTTQIDPALLQAVVAALHAVNSDNLAESSNNAAPAPVAGPSTSVPPEQPPARKTRGRKPKATYAENDEPTTPDASKSTRRTTRKKPRKSVEIIDEDAETDDTSVTAKRRPKRKRATSTSGDTEFTPEDGDGDGTATPKPRRRRRKSNVPTPPPYDPMADPGEDIDPTAVTMATLCDDIGTGRVSSKAAQILTNHATWRAANKAKRERMKAIMEAKKYGRNLEEEEENEAQREKEGSTVPEKVPEVTPEADDGAGPSGGEVEDLGIDKQDSFDYSQNMRTSRYTTQVRIGPNGEMIVDEQSLFVEQPGEEDTAGYTHVEESDTSKFVNSATYSRKMRGSRWSAEETELFYDALSQFGENYELISYVLPGRDRKACKNKLKAEDRRDPARVTYCLTHRKPVDVQTLSRMTGKDFSGPTPEIRAPTPVRLEIITHESDEQVSRPHEATKKKAVKKAPSVVEEGVEVLGNLSDVDVDDEELPDRPF